ncbi:MAG: hypothetical protein R3E73_01500 [Porticoccaceae bacterium]
MTTAQIQPSTDFEELMLSEAESFVIESNDSGEPVYSWVDHQVDRLPTHKLEDIVRLSELPECDLDPTFLDAIIVELLCRRTGMVC